MFHAGGVSNRLGGAKTAALTQGACTKMKNNTLLYFEQAEFEAYVASFLNGEAAHDAMYRLKKEHSLRVLENARQIGAELPPAQARLLELAALYHDLGRFEQLRRFGTFLDAESLNHGRLGSLLLREERFLRGLDRRERGLVRLAVLMHNRYDLPAKLAPELAPFCQALREADQLDILGIMRREIAPGKTPDPTVVMGLRDEPGAYTPALLESAKTGQGVNYGAMRYVNDFRLLLYTWPARMRFAASRRILARQGHMAVILAGLPDSAEFAPLHANMAALLEQPK